MYYNDVVCDGVQDGRNSVGMKQPLPFRVFMAKYNYDPLEKSPNEFPEAELVLNMGDYIFIYGDMDEVRWWAAIYM